MDNLIVKFGAMTRTCTPTMKTFCAKIFKRDYKQNVALNVKGRVIHPYKRIHPWKSLAEFSKDLADNAIYNQDGLVVLNKPYGIIHRRAEVQSESFSIPNNVEYTLQDALPYIAKQLNYSNLTVIRKPEKYMTGVTILSENTKVQNAVELALRRGNNFTKTFWVITTRVPNKLKGKERLAIKMEINRHLKIGKPVIVTSWSNNEKKRQDVKILNTEFKVLSNSTLNLCSLVEIKSSTQRWHALRLFAATFLYCPILGDNIFASRIQKIGNAYVKVDPFQDYTALPPVLNKEILQLLNLRRSQQHIIPVHIHLRSVVLPSFLGKDKDLTLEAPLMPPFDWTCQQLEFKYFTENK